MNRASESAGPPGTSARIFINYRRSDSAGWARQLHGDLGRRFGVERVFRDVAIEPGVDFVERIEGVMDACEVCITVIGPRWANATTPDGGRRLDEPVDLVRLEIERALERPDVQVIPVLVDGARMPGESELPGGLRPLARRHACELSDSRWDYDVEVLCRRLRHVLGESTVEHERRTSQPADLAHEGPAEPTAGSLLPVVATLAAAAGAAVGAALVSAPLAGARDAPLWSRLEEYAIERGMIWAIVGAVVAAAVAATFGRVRIPLGPAFVGAGAGLIAGAAGGAGHVAIRELTEHAEWLMRLVGIALPGMALAVVLARIAGARAGECALAALTGAVMGSLLGTEQISDRTLRLTVHIVLAVGAIVAILAVPSHRSLYSRQAVASRRTAAR